MSEHKLTGCRNRCLFQFRRASEFLASAQKCLPTDEGHYLRQYLYQSSVLMIQSYYEEYLRCVVSLGTFWKAPDIRLHLGDALKRQDDFAAKPAAELTQEAQRRVSFDDGAARLKSLFNVIVGGSPFADEQSERKCLDFVAVRNIIAHRGGWPTDVNVPTIKTPGVLLASSTVGTSTFYTMTITKAFFEECLEAIGRSIDAVEAQIAGDPVFQ